MRKSSWPALIALPSILWASVSCSVFRRRPLAYPTGLVFPVTEDAAIDLESRPGPIILERNGISFFCTQNGLVGAVNARRKVLWKTPLGKGPLRGPYGGQDTLYVLQGGETLHALNFRGDILWTERFGETIRTSVVEGKEWIHFGSEAGTLWSLRIKDRFRRLFRAGAAIGSGPVVSGAAVVFGTEDGKAWFIPPGGDSGAYYQVPGKILAPMASDGKAVFFGTDRREIHALSITSRKRKWKAKLGGYLAADPVIHGPRLFILGSNGVLYCLKASTGAILWWQNISSPHGLGLVIVDKTVAVSSLSDRLDAFDLKTGDRAGEFRAKRNFLTNPVWIDPDLVVARLDDPPNEAKLVFLRKDVRLALDPQKDSPQPVGEEILFSARTAGFFKPKYEFFIKTVDGLEIVRKPSETGSWSWYFDAEGSYQVGVVATDEKQSREAVISFVIEKRAEKKTDNVQEKEKKP